MKLLALLLFFFAALLPAHAFAMSAVEMVAALQSAEAYNGNADAPIVLQVSAAKDAGQKISSVSSITFVGPTVHVGPGDSSVETPAVINVLLP